MMGYTILEKIETNGMWSVRVRVSDKQSEFFTFDHDPTQGEIDQAVDTFLTPSQVPSQKSIDLQKAENAYILFMRSIGLPDKAGTEEIEAFVMTMMQSNPIQALTIAVKSLALINNVTQNGGKWADIGWHEGVLQ